MFFGCLRENFFVWDGTAFLFIAFFFVISGSSGVLTVFNASTSLSSDESELEEELLS